MHCSHRCPSHAYITLNRKRSHMPRDGLGDPGQTHTWPKAHTRSQPRSTLLQVPCSSWHSPLIQDMIVPKLVLLDTHAACSSHLHSWQDPSRSPSMRCARGVIIFPWRTMSRSRMTSETWETSSVVSNIEGCIWSDKRHVGQVHHWEHLAGGQKF